MPPDAWPQFVLTAHDHTDADAPARRLAARPAHLAGARLLKAAGHLLLGGALLNDAGRMVGSVMVVRFPDRAALDTWLDHEPYLTRHVWQHVRVQPFRVANVEESGTRP